MSKKSIYYYNYFITHNDELTNITMRELIEKIRLFNSTNRFRYTHSGNIKLRAVELNHKEYLKACFAKYRHDDDKPFLGNTHSDEASLIKQDVLEHTSVIFDDAHHIALIEYNHFGCRPMGIKYYLETFLPISETDKWKVELYPIQNPKGIDEIATSEELKQIIMDLDLMHHETFFALSERNENGLFKRLIHSFSQAKESFHANHAQIILNNGRNRNELLNIHDIIAELRDLNIDHDLFMNVKLKYRNTHNNKLEEIDLKNPKVYKRFIEFDDTGWEARCDDIINDYVDNDRYGSNHYQSHPNPVRRILPNLIE